jgi:hypothetical protein
VATASGGRRRPVQAALDLFFFVFAGMASLWLAWLVLREGVEPGWRSLLVLVFWLLVAYLALPRVHRILSAIYLPDYFIGRTRTADGLLGDPVNLALRGPEVALHAAMERAGWTRADDLSFRTGWRIVTSTLTRRSYPAAPVSPLLLFGRQQDFAYQQEVAGSPSKRHHVRFWRCPDGWLLPGGFQVDWLAAGTYDRSVGLSLFTGQITHKIAKDVDVERDHIVASLTLATPATELEVLANFASGYHSRNGGGDLIETDGNLPVLDLTRVAPSGPDVPEPAVPVPVVPRRPPQTVFGAATAGLRGLFLAALLVASPDLLTTAAGVVIGVAALLDVSIAVAVLARRNWARIWLCGTSVVTIVLAYIGNATGSERIRLETNLVTVAISVLVLLALSSKPAREFASRVSA